MNDAADALAFLGQLIAARLADFHNRIARSMIGLLCLLFGAWIVYQWMPAYRHGIALLSLAASLWAIHQLLLETERLSQWFDGVQHDDGR